jgi:hypothetical protein
MPWIIPAIIGGATYLGSREQAGATEAAANTSSASQLEAARLAAEAAKFRPVGITTRFGKSNFQMSPEGYLTGAGYEVSPELKAYQDRLTTLTGGALTQAEAAQQQYLPLQTAATGLFKTGQQYLNMPAEQRLTSIAEQQFTPSAGAQALTSLGQQYVGQSPQDVAARYMQQQQDLLAPSRERQMSQLQNQLFQQGRSGLSVGATGARPSGAAGLGASNPELEAYYNAMAQQDLGLASQAQQAGQQQASFGAGLLAQQQALEQARYGFGADLLARQQAMEQGRTAFGAGLFGTGAGLLGQYQAGQVGALNPFTTYLGAGQAIEGLGQEPLRLGAELGGRASTAGANVGQFLFSGGRNAALTQQGGQGFSPEAGLFNAFADNPQFTQGLQNYFNPFRTSAFSDSYQANIPVNNQSSGYY